MITNDRIAMITCCCCLCSLHRTMCWRLQWPWMVLNWTHLQVGDNYLVRHFINSVTLVCSCKLISISILLHIRFYFMRFQLFCVCTVFYGFSLSLICGLVIVFLWNWKMLTLEEWSYCLSLSMSIGERLAKLLVKRSKVKLTIV